MLQNITDLTNKYNTLKQDYDALKIEADGTKQGLQKIIDNLFATGAITTGGITTFDFSKEGTNTVHLAYGTINHYGLAPDGPYYIKTAKSSPAGSTTVGV